jgi:spore maturation protein CgeB
MGRVYAAHRISLNVHAAVVRAGTNMRSFECAAYGIAQLVEHRAQLERYFEPGVEIATYAEAQELQASLRSLLGDPARCADMATRARRRALAEHTYAHRARALLEPVL